MTALSGLTVYSSSDQISNVTKAIEYWADFQEELKIYLADLMDEDKDYVTIDGQQYDKDSTSALYKMEWWTNDVESTLDAILNNIKFEMDIADKINALVG